MTSSPLVDLATAAVQRWAGLPAISADDALAELGLAYDPALAQWSLRGEPPTEARWIGAPSRRFAGGLRLWLADDDTVELVEAMRPLADDGSAIAAPDLGSAEAAIDLDIDGTVLARGELVYAARGLAVRCDPKNRALLGLLGFAPTSLDDYLARLRPAPERVRPLHFGGEY